MSLIAGPELDKLIHDHVMAREKPNYGASFTISRKEWENRTPIGRPSRCLCGSHESCEICTLVQATVIPSYSTDISAAWEVVEKIVNTIHAKFLIWYNQSTECWVAEIQNSSVCKYANTAAHAICLAALQMEGIEV